MLLRRSWVCLWSPPLPILVLLPPVALDVPPAPVKPLVVSG
jgi:hypothetical protein